MGTMGSADEAGRHCGDGIPRSVFGAGCCCNSEMGCTERPVKLRWLLRGQQSRGVVHVGFTAAQEATVTAMKTALAATGTMATNRVEPYLAVPPRPLVSLGQMAQAVVGQPGGGTIRGVFIDEQASRLEVVAENVVTAQGWVTSKFGAGAPVTISPYIWHGSSGRWRRTGPIMAGDGIVTQYIDENGKGLTDRCSAGFGASEKVGNVWRPFLLTAGHCDSNQTKVWGRINEAPPNAPPMLRIGEMMRNALEHEVNHFATDGAAITLDNGLAPPRTIYPATGQSPIRITGVAPVVKGMPICTSGAKSDGIRHGQIREKENWTGAIQVPRVVDKYGDVVEWWPYTYEALTSVPMPEGDSGGPVWQCGTGKAIGLMAADNGHGLSGLSTLLPPLPPDASGTLYPWKFEASQAPGILGASGMGNMHITTAD